MTTAATTTTDATPIVHIVTWRLNGATPEARCEQAQQIVQAFEAARHEVPGLLRMEVGQNLDDAASADGWDLALYMVFASRDAMRAYEMHPSHLRIKALVKPMRSARGQVDFFLTA